MLEQKQIMLLKYNRNTYYIFMNKFVIICYELLMCFPIRQKGKEEKTTIKIKKKK